MPTSILAFFLVFALLRVEEDNGWALLGETRQWRSGVLIVDLIVKIQSLNAKQNIVLGIEIMHKDSLFNTASNAAASRTWLLTR